jgi:hypothetical protein
LSFKTLLKKVLYHKMFVLVFYESIVGLVSVKDYKHSKQFLASYKQSQKLNAKL